MMMAFDLPSLWSKFWTFFGNETEEFEEALGEEPEKKEEETNMPMDTDEEQAQFFYSCWELIPASWGIYVSFICMSIPFWGFMTLVYYWYFVFLLLALLEHGSGNDGTESTMSEDTSGAEFTTSDANDGW